MSDYITSKTVIALGILCAILAAADFFRDRHGTFEVEHDPLFHSAFGFITYIAIIFLAKGLRKLILRPEDYYGADATDRENEHAAGAKGADDA